MRCKSVQIYRKFTPKKQCSGSANHCQLSSVQSQCLPLIQHSSDWKCYPNGYLNDRETWITGVSPVQQEANICDGRESNPGQPLGRQLCSPLYHHHQRFISEDFNARNQWVRSPRVLQQRLVKVSSTLPRIRDPYSSICRLVGLRVWGYDSG